MIVEENKELLLRVEKAEDDFISLFSNGVTIGEDHRFYDDELKDMYDHNFSIVREINEDLLDKLLEIKKKREEKHIKITCPKRNEFLLSKGFEEEALLTMLKSDYYSWSVPSNDKISFRRIRQNYEAINELIDIEIKYYAEDYGEDFCRRRWIRYAEKVAESENGLDIWCVYQDDQMIGYCYTFYDQKTVCVDGLLVVEEYRHQYVASNLIKTIALFYNCPIYLHASENETPKEMYQKMGFKTIKTSYDYLKLDEDHE